MEINSEVRALWRWYSNETLLNRYKPPCEDELNTCEYGLITPVNELLSFQVSRPKVSGTPLTSWTLVDMSGNVIVDLTSAIVDNIQTVHFGTVDYFVFNGGNIGMDINAALLDAGNPCGAYQSVLTDGVNTWYSEVIKFSEGNDCRMRIEWTNSCGNIDNIYYRNGFKNVLYLDKDCYISDPKPKLVTVNIENGEKAIIEEFRRVEVEYEIELGLHPFHVQDALAKMLLCDSINVYLKNGAGNSQIKLVKLSADWDDVGYGCFALLKLSFQLHDAAINNPCCMSFVEYCGDDLICNESFFDVVDCWSAGGGWAANEDGSFTLNGWTVSSSGACHTPGSTNTLLNDVPDGVVINSPYRQVLIIKNRTAGNVVISMAGGSGITFSGNGTFVKKINSGPGGIAWELTPSIDFDGCITFAQVRQLCHDNFELEDDAAYSLRDDLGRSVLDN